MWPVVFGSAKGAAAGRLHGVLRFVLVAGLPWWRGFVAFGRGVADAAAWCRDRIG